MSLSVRVPFARVVFDTSTLVSAALRVGSIPHQALLRAYKEAVIFSSIETMDELEQVLLRPKFNAYLDRETRLSFIDSFRQNVQFVAVALDANKLPLPACRDPKDNKFLALIAAVEADVLVSSDRDLLDLHPWHGIAIIPPAEFLA